MGDYEDRHMVEMPLTMDLQAMLAKFGQMADRVGQPSQPEDDAEADLPRPKNWSAKTGCVGRIQTLKKGVELALAGNGPVELPRPN